MTRASSRYHYHQYHDSAAEGIQACRCGETRRAPRPPAVYAQPTSAAAAEAIRPRTRDLRALVLRTLDGRELTDQQIQDATGLGPQTITPRRIECARMGLVADTGRKAKTRSRKDAIVWRLVSPLDVALIDLARLQRRPRPSRAASDSDMVPARQGG